MIPNLFWPFANLLILLTVLAYYLRKPLKEFVNTRHVTLRDQIRGAAERLAAARALQAEVGAQVSRFDVEVAEMRAQAASELAEAKAKGLAQAQSLSDQIRKDVKAAGSDLEARVRADLIETVGLEIIDRASRMVSATLTSEHRRKLRQEFARDVEATL